MGSKGYAQTGALTVDATASPCDVKLTMYAIAPCITSTCGDLKSFEFTVGAGTTANWTNFGAFMAGGAPNWNIYADGYPPAACTDFQWASVKIEPTGVCSFPCAPPTPFDIGDSGIGCSSTSTSGNSSRTCLGTPYTLYGSWSPGSGSALSNVTITVY